MCPLVSAPARGYSDYQRLENFDTGILENFVTPGNNASFSSPVIDVSRFAYFCGEIREQSTQSAWAFNYFLDSLGSVFIGGYNFTCAQAGAQAGQLHIPNLGPFVQILVQAIGGVNFQASGSLFASNRVTLTQLIPPLPQLVIVNNFNMPAGNTNFFPNAMYAGPARLMMVSPVASTIIALEYLDTGGNYFILDEYTSGAVNAPLQATIICPLTAWKIVVNNPGVATVGLFVAVTPSVTGAA